MDPTITNALATERTIDITTTGARTGQPHRIEIWFHNVDDRIYITGMPGKRGWYANLLSDPQMTFHLKQSVTADLDATARPVRGEEKRRVLVPILERLGHSPKIDDWMDRSPLVEVQFA
ncbi:MAG: nitroreductase/quinone reductase family protein [Acidimicrobiia bacterium]|nr:nitroreductase/quinone reductase family protein [Acidimicrobiia bacterium]